MENLEIEKTQGVDELDFSPDALEQSLMEMDSASIDEFDSSIDFEKFVVLSKKDVSTFCRLVEPLQKASVDEYGRSVLVRCIDAQNVELLYYNNPYFIRYIVPNRSNKTIKTFAVSVSNLKKIVSTSFTSLILVEENNDINIALCESLLFLETKSLKESQYDRVYQSPNALVDKDAASYSFKKMGAILSLTDRASEKVAVIKDKCVNFSTGVFISRSISPFEGEENFVLYKQCSDILGILSETTKGQILYQIVNDSTLVIQADSVYCELPIGSSEKVNDFLSPVSDMMLSFEPTISIINDTFLRLISIVKSLDYLSDIVTLRFTKTTMELVISTSNQSRQSTYKYDILSGAPEIEGEIKLTTDVLKVFFNIVGSDVLFSFNENGLGIKNAQGKFLIRKS